MNLEFSRQSEPEKANISKKSLFFLSFGFTFLLFFLVLSGSAAASFTPHLDEIALPDPTDARKDGQTDGRTDGRTDGQILISSTFPRGLSFTPNAEDDDGRRIVF